MEAYKSFSDFTYHGVNICAFTNENGDVKKKIVAPRAIDIGNNKHYFKAVYDKSIGGYIKPNGISINTENISTIDVDRPAECLILDKLKADCKFYITTKNGFHFYFKKENVLQRSQKKGICDINLQNLFYIPTYCHNETGEEYHYKLIKSEALVDMPQYAIDYCNILLSINELTPKKAITSKKSTIEKIIINPSILIEKFPLKTMDVIFEIFHSTKPSMFDTFEGWRDIGYMSRHLNNTEECFKLFDTFARKGKDIIRNKLWDKMPEIDNRRCFFGKGEYNENFDENGVLIKCSKINKKMYKNCLHHLYKSKWEEQQIIFNSQYIYPEDGSNDYIFNDWVKNHKILALKSSYGTGKTYAFKKLLKNYKQFKRVLFITYRQSLATSLTKDLEENYNFKCYLDKDVQVKTEDRLIIQLDSLVRLNENINFITQQDNISKYDIIILDEIEGLLNHLSFEKLDQYLIHNILTRLLNKAPKILALDGDMNDRSYDFLSSVCPNAEYKFYQNTFQPNKKHFIFSHDQKAFDKSIDDDLKAGKRIVIVSMTKTESERFNDLYKDKYKTIIHNSVERNKDVLRDVNTEWTKCQLLIYSPSVESGVDFNIKNHFYKCYSVIHNQSTSFRAFNQMLNRVRYYENDNILCLMPSTMIYRVGEILYRYDEMKLNKYHGVEHNNLTEILIHNDVETINSNRNFICSLIETLNKKGHTHKYLDDYQRYTTGMTDVLKGHLVEAEDITDAQYQQLQEKQRNNEDLSRDEIHSVEKMFYKKVFHMNNDEIDDWIDEIYNKKTLVKNFNRLNKAPEERVENKEAYLNNFKHDKCDMLHDIMKIMGYSICKRVITKNKAIDFGDVKTKIETILNGKLCKTLFNHGRPTKTLNVMKIVNELIDGYGLNFEKSRSSKRVEGKVVATASYELKLTKLMEFVIDKIKTEEDIKAEENREWLLNCGLDD